MFLKCQDSSQSHGIKMLCFSCMATGLHLNFWDPYPIDTYLFIYPIDEGFLKSLLYYVNFLSRWLSFSQFAIANLVVDSKNQFVVVDQFLYIRQSKKETNF